VETYNTRFLEMLIPTFSTPKEFALRLNDEMMVLSLDLAGRVNSVVLASSLRNYYKPLLSRKPL